MNEKSWRLSMSIHYAVRTPEWMFFVFFVFFDNDIRQKTSLLPLPALSKSFPHLANPFLDDSDKSLTSSSFYPLDVLMNFQVSKFRKEGSRSPSKIAFVVRHAIGNPSGLFDEA